MKRISTTLRLTAVLLLLSLISTACMKKQNLAEEDLGPAIDPAAMTTALSDGFGPINYADMSIGEKTSIIVSQTLQGQTSQSILQQEVHIKSVTDTPTNLTLRLDALVTLYGGSSPQVEAIDDHDKIYNKQQGFAFAADSEDPVFFLFETLQNIALGACDNSGNYPESCHNLVTTNVSVKVPSALAPQHNCTDPTQCFINATRVEFDLVRHYQIEPDGRPKRIHYTFLLSNEVPFTSRVLRYCARTLYSLETTSQQVLADICYAVNNYTFGD